MLTQAWQRAGLWTLILVLSVATITLYVDNKRTRDCQASYMVVDQEASTARAAVAEGERQAFKQVLRTIVTERDPVKRSEAINAYVEIQDKNDAIRKANPIPVVPTKCR